MLAVRKRGYATADEIVSVVGSDIHAETWKKIARPDQLPPAGDWFTWLVMPGRGWGKTRTGAELTDSVARKSPRGAQLLVAGRTPADVRTFALFGSGGLLTHHPDIEYIPSNRLLIWPNGVEGIIRSGANPEEFRGFSGEFAWLDEFGAWDYPAECWNNLIFGMRERNPRICITTTPRPLKILKSIRAEEGTITVKGSSYDNRANLSEKWVKNVLDKLKDSRLGLQEVYGEILEDVEGALWNLKMIDDARVKMSDVPPLIRVAVGVDPQGTKKVDDDDAIGGVNVGGDDDTRYRGPMTGIVVAGIAGNGHIYIMEDVSMNGTPAEWGNRVIATYQTVPCDVIVAERNYGGDMVEHTLRTILKKANIRIVSASRGKTVRAEPISSLYEQGLVHHVSSPHGSGLAPLEDEMTSYTPDTAESPNRMDAMVWAVSELIGDPQVKKKGGTWGRRETGLVR